MTGFTEFDDNTANTAINNAAVWYPHEIIALFFVSILSCISVRIDSIYLHTNLSTAFTPVTDSIILQLLSIFLYHSQNSSIFCGLFPTYFLKSLFIMRFSHSNVNHARISNKSDCLQFLKSLVAIFTIHSSFSLSS